MGINELNSVLWSRNILALPEDEQAEAIKCRILDARQDYDCFVATSLVLHAALYQKIMTSPTLGTEVYNRLFQELERRHSPKPVDSLSGPGAERAG